MKTALIFAVRVAGAHRFGWRWRAEDNARECRRAFKYFYECFEAARKAGYECRFERGDEFERGASQQSVVPGAT